MQNKSISILSPSFIETQSGGVEQFHAEFCVKPVDEIQDHVAITI